MQVHEFPCPGCRARLRLKGRPSSARKLDCPDCQARFIVRSDDTGAIESELIEPGRKTAEATPEPADSRTTLANSILTTIRTHPSRVAWSATTALVALLILWLASGSESNPEESLIAQVDSGENVIAETGETDGNPGGTVPSNDSPGGADADIPDSDSEDASGAVVDRANADDLSDRTADAGRPAPIEGVSDGNTGDGGVGQTAANATARSTVDPPESADSELERGLAEVAGFLSGGVGVTDPLKPELTTGTDAGEVENQSANGTSATDSEPATVELPEPVLKTAEEFESILKVEFVEYKQAEPISLKYQLAELNEILEVPFVLSEDLQNRAPEWWDQPLLVSMQKCTVQDIMSYILKEAGLVSDFRDGELHFDIAPEGTEGQ